MENASKALIMAAEILLGVMLISIAVYLFNTIRIKARQKVTTMRGFRCQPRKLYSITDSTCLSFISVPASFWLRERTAGRR